MDPSPRRCRIGIAVSTQTHIDQISAIAGEQKDEIFVANKGLEEAVEAARALEREHDIEVVLARRGTATLLRENLTVPVLAFPRDSLGILSTLRQAAQVGRKILFTEFRDEIPGLELIEEILGIQIVQGIYHDKLSLEEQVRAAKQKGCTVAVGGGLTVRFAHEYGLKGIELALTEKELLTTFENARAVALSNRREREETRRYQSVVDAVSEGVIAFDKQGCVSTINRAAREMLRIGGDPAIGHPVTDVLRQTSAPSVLQDNRPKLDVVEQIGEDRFLFSHLPIALGEEIIGGVSSFRKFSEVMSAENVVRRSLSKGLVARYRFDEIVHFGPVMRDLIETAARFAQTESTVLITGESGTGKELFAQGIHNASRRRRKPFVSLNCAALPENLMESELFGYEEGAFTGSKKGGKPGLLELAHTGTIFLDEIGETPLPVQVNLLRVLQEREVMRLGSDRRVPIDIRIITATNRDLAEQVRKGSFREDLYFRLDVLEIPIPPLRDRTEDIPHLTEHFVSRISRRYGLPPLSIPMAAQTALMEYPWPGNIRQLRNFIERLVVVCEGTFSQEYFDLILRQQLRYRGRATSDSEQKATLPQTSVFRPALANEEGVLRDALQRTNFHRGNAAKALGISRTTLWKKMKLYGIG